MSTTQPIRSKQLLHDFKEYYLTKQPNFRNYTLILIGLNTALRINDILHLSWSQKRKQEKRPESCSTENFRKHYSPTGQHSLS